MKMHFLTSIQINLAQITGNISAAHKELKTNHIFRVLKHCVCVGFKVNGFILTIYVKYIILCINN